MQPIVATVASRRPVEEVFDYLVGLGNRQHFTDHMLARWELREPASGLGATAVAMALGARRGERIQLEIVEVERPSRIVERSVAERGKRESLGSYLLRRSADGGTDIRFELKFIRLSPRERLIAPALAAVLQAAHQRAMDRLAVVLDQHVLGVPTSH
jgi:uncharacterized protein YndB with AHSA1/START domain